MRLGLPTLGLGSAALVAARPSGAELGPLTAPTLELLVGGVEASAGNEGSEVDVAARVQGIDDLDTDDTATTTGIELYLDDLKVGDFTDAGGGTWTYAIAGSGDELLASDEGDYYAKRVTDRGDVESDVVAFGVNAPAAPTLTAPGAGIVLLGENVTVSATTTDSDLDRIDFVLDPGGSEIVIATDSSAAYSQTWVPAEATGVRSLVPRAVRGSASTDGAPVSVTIRGVITFGTIGAQAVGTTSLAVPYPASPAAGDLFFLGAASKYSPNDPTAPASWAIPTNGQAFGGAGASGVDSGNATATAMTAVAAGGESGNLTVNVPSGNCAAGRMARYTKNGGTWDVAAVNATDLTAGTDWSAAAASVLDIQRGDVLVAVSGINSDNCTFTSQTVTASGCTFTGDTERNDGGTSGGQDCGLVMSEHTCATGPASGAPTYAMTANGTSGNFPAGATILVRLRAA